MKSIQTELCFSNDISTTFTQPNILNSRGLCGLFNITLLISIKRDHKLKRSIVYSEHKNLRIHKIRTCRESMNCTYDYMKIWYLS